MLTLEAEFSVLRDKFSTQRKLHDYTQNFSKLERNPWMLLDAEQIQLTQNLTKLWDMRPHFYAATSKPSLRVSVALPSLLIGFQNFEASKC